MESNPRAKYIGGCLLVAIAVVVIAALLGVRTVDSGTIGIKKTFGQVQGSPLDPGLHIVTPLKDTVTKFDIRTRKIESSENSASKDLQTIQTTVAVNYHVPSNKALEIYTEIGNNESVENTILKPAISEATKASTAKFTAEENITKREELKKSVEEKLRARLTQYGVEVESVSIANLAFSPEFDKAIEEKQVAEQNAKKASYQQEQAKVEADTRVINARADAEKQRLLQETLSPQLLQKMWVEKWNGELPKYTGADNAFINIPE